MGKNITRRTTPFNSQSEHNAFGIQKWLVMKGFCVKRKTDTHVNDSMYSQTINAFCAENEKVFKCNKSKESFVQKNFTDFCNFCIKRFAVIE